MTTEPEESFPSIVPTPGWSSSIPHSVQKKMARAIESHLNELPLHLQFEWRKPCYIERSFFVEASKYLSG